MAAATEQHETSKSRPTPEKKVEAAEAAELGGGLRQIQRIIVEPRARELEVQLQALDARRSKDLAELRREVDRSINRSDDFIKKESAVLNERLGAERRERTRALDDRAAELSGHARRLEERVDKLQEQLASETRDLRQLILDQYRQYNEELRTWRDDMAKAIARELTGLRSEKADRSVIAELLSEVGERLGGAGGPPTTH